MGESEDEKNKIAERRAAPRFKVNLKASVLIMIVWEGSVENERFLPLVGQTRDVSQSGIAVLISKGDLAEIEKLAGDWIMKLLLPLPSGSIELEAEPRRFQPFDERDAGKVLVGAHITNMSGRDRIVFIEFIRECETRNLQDSVVPEVCVE